MLGFATSNIHPRYCDKVNIPPLKTKNIKQRIKICKSLVFIYERKKMR